VRHIEGQFLLSVAGFFTVKSYYIMRFARFLFALFLGAFFFIVLMKLLFFGLIAAIIIGGVSWAMRARAYHHRYGSPYSYTYQYHPWQQRHSPFEGNMTQGPTPLEPRWQTTYKTTPSYSRRIEVI
jgi:hypothetical protein